MILFAYLNLVYFCTTLDTNIDNHDSQTQCGANIIYKIYFMEIKVVTNENKKFLINAHFEFIYEIN